MIGRGAVRNPWLFTQIRQQTAGESVQYPTGRAVLQYVQELWDSQMNPGFAEETIRRVSSRAEFFRVCTAYLDHDDSMPLEPQDKTAEEAAMDAVCTPELALA
jgi:tRNA-dihydrouridine synthase